MFGDLSENIFVKEEFGKYHNSTIFDVQTFRLYDDIFVRKVLCTLVDLILKRENGLMIKPTQTGGINLPTAPKNGTVNMRNPENSKKRAQKRPPQAPTPHQYPGIYRIYEYGLHKASGV